MSLNTEIEKRVEERATRIAKIYALTIEDSKNIWVDLAKQPLIWEIEAIIEVIKKNQFYETERRIFELQSDLKQLRGEQ